MQHLNPTSCHWHDRTRAFTVVELLVSITIIFIIITTAFIAFRTIRRGAERTVSLNALRQMMVAYNAYADAHKNRLMPGYVDPDHVGTMAGDIVPFAKLPNGAPMQTEDSVSYVWRLAPYLDYAWKTYMTDYRSPAFIARMETEFSAGIYGPGTTTDPATQLGIASVTSFGLNSIFMGGDEIHGGPEVIDLRPWDWEMPSGHLINNPNKIAATRGSEVKMPSKLIVFGATKAMVPPAAGDPSLIMGHPELRPPYASYDPITGALDLQQWSIDPSTNEIDFSGTPAPGGIPFDRQGQHKVPVGHFDGSVDNYSPLASHIDSPNNMGAAASIMSRWSPFAYAPN